MTTTTATGLADVPAAMQDLVHRVVSVIRQHVDPKLIILFGSWAEGRARPDSDLDVLVVGPMTERLSLAVQIKRALRPLLGRRHLDLFLVPTEDWERVRAVRGMVGWEADHSGVRLYEEPTP